MNARTTHVRKSGRTRFAAAGALTGLLAALCLEVLGLHLRLATTLQQRQAPVLISPVTPLPPRLRWEQHRPPVPAPVNRQPAPHPGAAPAPNPPPPAHPRKTHRLRTRRRVVCYLVDTRGKFGKIDVATGVYTPIADFHVPFADIAYDPRGGLYAVDCSSGAQSLYRLYPGSGRLQKIARLNPPGGIAGLVFSKKGVLLGGTQTSDLVRIDTRNGRCTTLMRFPPYATAGDLAFDQRGRLFVSTESNDLLRLDIRHRTYQRVGSMGYTGVRGLARGPDGVIYGFSFDRKCVFAVDLSTGQGRFVSDFSSAGIDDGGGTSFATEASRESVVIEDKPRSPGRPQPGGPYAWTRPPMPSPKKPARLPPSHQAVAEPIRLPAPPRDPRLALATVTAWLALLGMLLPPVLVLVQSHFLRRSLLSRREVARAMALGTTAGALTGLAGQAPYGLSPLVGPAGVLAFTHAGCFALAGAVLGLGMSRAVPGISPRLALIVVPVGGLLASTAYQAAVAAGSPTLGRLLAAGLLGAAVGVLLSLTAAETRDAPRRAGRGEAPAPPAALHPDRFGPTVVLRPPGPLSRR